MSGDATQADQLDLFSQALFMLDEVDDEVRLYKVSIHLLQCKIPGEHSFWTLIYFQNHPGTSNHK